MIGSQKTESEVVQRTFYPKQVVHCGTIIILQIIRHSLIVITSWHLLRSSEFGLLTIRKLFSVQFVVESTIIIFLKNHLQLVQSKKSIYVKTQKQKALCQTIVVKRWPKQAHLNGFVLCSTPFTILFLVCSGSSL